MELISFVQFVRANRVVVTVTTALIKLNCDQTGCLQCML